MVLGTDGVGIIRGLTIGIDGTTGVGTLGITDVLGPTILGVGTLGGGTQDGLETDGTMVGITAGTTIIGTTMVGMATIGAMEDQEVSIQILNTLVKTEHTMVQEEAVPQRLALKVEMMVQEEQ